jgi:hypothetical protein
MSYPFLQRERRIYSNFEILAHTNPSGGKHVEQTARRDQLARGEGSGARGRNRTTDTRIFNPLLYP